jgi:glyoxylase-like metal-dependent hydrolase (beta-lactamase superfamily II)
MTQADLEFWTDEAKSSDPLIGGLIAPTRATLLPNRGRIVFIKDDQEIIPGVHAIATPGHTVGHMSIVISSQGKSLMYTADVAHQYVLVTANPRAEFIFDTDPAQAIATRLRVFDMVAAQRMPVLIYHFPWPGIGHIVKTGDSYRWVPASVATAL